ncbi:ashwin isoform X2 [Protobothrops mucrosquamatus]|uniref:ashwin isoform X2 n=1 Tax=Protobothrops mucrosquamatus TaxID=103944 RepID=UPI0007758CD9|nr:ashwin isoform X2 [Protobothrops mucrosquamatus]
MAAFRDRGFSAKDGSGDVGRVDSDLLLHPELLSQEFLLLTLEQNIPVEDEMKISKDGLTDLYIQHVIPLPQRDLPKTRWGRAIEKKRGQQVLKHGTQSIMAMESLRKRPLIVFDGSSTSTSIKVRKTENGAEDDLKFLTPGSTNITCKSLAVPSNSRLCISAPTFSYNEAKQNNIVINMSPGQKLSALEPLTGTNVTLKRAAPKEELDSSVSISVLFYEVILELCPN